MAETCKRIVKYCIIKHCFYYESEKEPYFEVVPESYDTREAAEEAATKLCLEETKELNAGKVKDGLNFTGDTVDLEKYTCCTTAWDGDDYRIVTGYIIQKTRYRQENNHA